MLNAFKADLHIHTVLSPCGDLEMSPSAIVDRALQRGLDMIAISDHNTTRQVKVTQKIGREKGLFVLGGVEVTSQEETHCLCYFRDDEQLDAFQEFLDEHLPKIPNDEDRFGYQLIVDEEDENRYAYQERELLRTLGYRYRVSQVQLDFADRDSFDICCSFVNDGIAPIYAAYEVELDIYDRHGMLMFESDDPDFEWDGTYNGKDVKEGTYFILVKAKGADGREYNIRKDVNLLRGFTEETTLNN